MNTLSLQCQNEWYCKITIPFVFSTFLHGVALPVSCAASLDRTGNSPYDSRSQVRWRNFMKGKHEFHE